MITETLSHYRVLEEIGAGGMGRVYRAHDDRLDRDVALKVLPAGLLSDELARRRFRREACALAKLNHPNVGAIYEFGEEEGVDFVAMELVCGASLDDRLAAGPLPEEEVLRLGAQLADALGASHAQGIIHRDLKPGNLRLTADGRLKVLDFGLAQWKQAEAHDALTVTALEMPEFGGTLAYMAPEQLRGRPADPRTDVYAAGAVLYEMATGERPFSGTSGPFLIGAILEKEPSRPSNQNPELSLALESIILKAIEKDPEMRYQSAQELGDDLERARQGNAPASQKWWWRPAMRAASLLRDLVFMFG